MKKLVLLPLLFLSFVMHSQMIDYTAIRKVISETYPEIDFSNKLLAISVWNSTDKTSRDMNTELHRTYTVSLLSNCECSKIFASHNIIELDSIL